MAVFHYFGIGLDMAQLKDQLKELREQRKITQTRLAELIGVSPRVYNRWENGDAVPHWDSVVKIAEALDVSLDQLAGRTGKSDKVVIHNLKLHELYKKVNELSDEDQQALIVLLDSLVARADLQKLVSASQSMRK
ncbi:helix-turn-helix domain-containing protein [Teredinibacter haidensis]|uniref:helix-turn-helix domain-containing protein n=1 Tax=Teredinibacter haidensis TaxID=2731755 RepID=UPI000948A685|nr:helix-turn-helix transcriptional regulator [Teredinibacter haidensis]